MKRVEHQFHISLIKVISDVRSSSTRARLHRALNSPSQAPFQEPCSGALKDDVRWMQLQYSTLLGAACTPHLYIATSHPNRRLTQRTRYGGSSCISLRFSVSSGVMEHRNANIGCQIGIVSSLLHVSYLNGPTASPQHSSKVWDGDSHVPTLLRRQKVEFWANYTRS